MAGPLAAVGTITSAVNLDVQRLLYMGQGAALELWTPDASQVVTLGMRLVRRYEKSFNRVVEDESVHGDGAEIVFHIADYGFPVGQLKADLETPNLWVRYFTGTGPQDGPFGFYKVNIAPPVSPVREQVYVVVAMTKTLRKAFFGR